MLLLMMSQASPSFTKLHQASPSFTAQPFASGMLMNKPTDALARPTLPFLQPSPKIRPPLRRRTPPTACHSISCGLADNRHSCAVPSGPLTIAHPPAPLGDGRSSQNALLARQRESSGLLQRPVSGHGPGRQVCYTAKASSATTTTARVHRACTWT
ncbi:hypothetical protein BKA80DRAFT_279113 [Phyllosticta citrichinensis]